MPRIASFPSGAGSTASWREKKGKRLLQKRHNTKSLEKEHLCQHYYLATSPSQLHSILFQYSNTEHSSIVSRTLQSKTSSWLDSKAKLFDLWSGSTKRSDAKGKRSAWGCLRSAPFLSCPLPLILVLCEKPRVPSQKILLEYNQAWTQRMSETRGPNFLLDNPNFS